MCIKVLLDKINLWTAFGRIILSHSPDLRLSLTATEWQTRLGRCLGQPPWSWGMEPWRFIL